MTRLDWIIVGFAAFTALMGYRRGLVRTALSLAGLAAGAAWGLVLVWVVGAVALQVPGPPTWHRDARRSQVLHRLNEFVPPRDVLQLRAGLIERLST